MGCQLGEDAFLTEVESETMTETLPQFNHVPGMEKVQGG